MSTATASPRAAFAYPEFRRYQLARFLLVLGIQVQSVVVGWQVYALTERPLDLGWVGLAHFLPIASLSLVGGQVADRFDRVHVLLASIAVMGLCASLLAVFAVLGTGTAPIYAVIVLFGAARAFSGPASSALITHLVPDQHLGNAIAWGSTVWQVATIGGPALGGALYAVFGGAAGPYVVSAALATAAFSLIATLETRTGGLEKRALTLDVALEGLRYVRAHPLLLGVMSLDLFAVLLGGATALLPAIAKDVLHAGPIALGVLRSAPALGAATVAVFLASRPIGRGAGKLLFASVALYGLATIAFGLSHSVPLSMLALVIAGGADMVSVVVRQTLIQLHTPTEMRGRVSAVNLVFIGASNELGEFESGVTAQALGVVRAIVAGGVGTLVVVGLWAWRFPALRRIDRLDRGAA
jgi:MFS family permease